VKKYKNTFYQHHTRGGLCATPHNDNHSESFGTSINCSERNEDRFCPQSVKDGVVSVFHTKNRNILSAMLKYNDPLEERKPHRTLFLFSAKPHRDSSGRLKSYPFKLQNTRGENMRVSLKRADPRHIIVTNSNSQDGVVKGP
jgi:hypothetical protein